MIQGTIGGAVSVGGDPALYSTAPRSYPSGTLYLYCPRHLSDPILPTHGDPRSHACPSGERLNYLAVISMPPPCQCGLHASHLIFSQSVWMGLHGLDSHPPPHRTHQGSDSDRDAEAEEESEGE